MVPKPLQVQFQVELFRKGFRQSHKQAFCRLEMSGIQLLKIGQNNLGSRRPGFVQSPRHKRSLAHLASTLNQDDAVMSLDCIAKVVVSGTNDIELRVEWNSTA